MSRYNFLFDEIKQNKCQTIMEIGTCRGHSGLRMLDAAKTNYTYHTITYYGFDLFEDLDEATFSLEVAKHPRAQAEALDYLKQSGCNIILTKGFSRDTIPNFYPDRTIDFIFIDGGHSKQTVIDDWNNIQRFITKDTIIMFDDYLSEFDKLTWGSNFIVDKLDPTKYIITRSPEFDTFNFGNVKSDVHIIKVMLR